MLDHALEEKLIDDLQEMHALEQRTLRQLESVLPTQRDEALVAELRRQIDEGREHALLLAGSLSAAGEVAGEADVPALASDGTDGAPRALRDVYVAACAAIAGYQLLERVAERADDEETAEVARSIREQRTAAAARLDRHWDAAVDQTLADQGIRAAA